LDDDVKKVGRSGPHTLNMALGLAQASSRGSRFRRDVPTAVRGVILARIQANPRWPSGLEV
jgi:hypothetical protein